MEKYQDVTAEYINPDSFSLRVNVDGVKIRFVSRYPYTIEKGILESLLGRDDKGVETGEFKAPAIIVESLQETVEIICDEERDITIVKAGPSGDDPTSLARYGSTYKSDNSRLTEESIASSIRSYEVTFKREAELLDVKGHRKKAKKDITKGP